MVRTRQSLYERSLPFVHIVMLFLGTTQLRASSSEAEDIWPIIELCIKQAPMNSAIQSAEPISLTTEIRPLYIHQREFAVIGKIVDTFPFEVCSHACCFLKGSSQWMGGDDATTCLLLITREATHNITSCIHLDGGRTTFSLLRMFRSMFELAHSDPVHGEMAVELSLLGAYEDERGTSRRLLLELFSFFLGHGPRLLPGLRCHLRACIVGAANTKQRGAWRVPKVRRVLLLPKVRFRPRERFPLLFLLLPH